MRMMIAVSTGLKSSSHRRHEEAPKALGDMPEIWALEPRRIYVMSRLLRSSCFGGSGAVDTGLEIFRINGSRG